MSDTEDKDFDEAFKGFGDELPKADPTTPTPPAEPPKVEEPAATPPAEPPKEEPKKDEEPAKKPEETPPVATDEKKPEEGAKPPETPETPPAEEPKPLTKDDVKSVVSDLLTTERSSGKALDNATKEVLDAYYPEGLSNVLTDEQGKKLQSPADVVEASGGKMSTEEAAQWLMNEQFKLDQQVEKIKSDAKSIAENTINFRRDAVTAVEKYEPLFKAYPHLQKKVYDLMMKQVKADEKKNVILSAPDVIELYDTYLEPYQQAYEFAKGTPATVPTAPTTPEPPKPGAEDRMDEAGDGGSSAPDDPNDFAQQVNKELAKEI